MEVGELAGRAESDGLAENGLCKCTFINTATSGVAFSNQLAALRVVSRSTTIINSEWSQAMMPLG